MTTSITGLDPVPPVRHQCLLCAAYVRPAGDAPIECAFPDGRTFSPDNWGCRTLLRLREVAEDLGDSASGRHQGSDPVATVYDDEWCFVLPFPWHSLTSSLPDEALNQQLPLFIVLQWYKHRGRCRTAFTIGDDGQLWPLRLPEALLALTGWSKTRDDRRKDPNA